MRSNLEHRIIEKSLAMSRPKRRSKGMVASFFDAFVLPKPAVSMAVALIIGVMSGLYSAGTANNINDVDADVYAYFLNMPDTAQNYEDGGFLL